MFELPQIVGAADEESYLESKELFKAITDDIKQAGTVEAELAELLSNAWRYIKFSAKKSVLYAV